MVEGPRCHRFGRARGKSLCCMTSPSLPTNPVALLLRGEAQTLRGSVDQTKAAQVALYVTIILLGAGLYGAAVGGWRSPIQGGYTAIKFPLILLLTTIGN